MSKHKKLSAAEVCAATAAAAWRVGDERAAHAANIKYLKQCLPHLKEEDAARAVNTLQHLRNRLDAAPLMT